MDHADLVYAHSFGADKMAPDEVLGPRGVLWALAKARNDGRCWWAKTFQPLSPREERELLIYGKQFAEKWGAVYGPVA